MTKEDAGRPDEQSSDCAFCQPDAADVVADLEYTRVILFPRPIKLGHLAVVPKRHVRSISGLTDMEAAEVGTACARMVRALEAAMSVVKVYVIAIGDRDPHFHFHLLPRLPDEPSLGEHSIASTTPWRKSIKGTTVDSQRAFADALRGLV